MQGELSAIRSFCDKQGFESDLALESTACDKVGEELINATAKMCASLSQAMEERLKIDDSDARLLRAHLMVEELGEVLAGLAHADELALLDGLADLVYVVLGTAVTFDLPLTEAFWEVQRSNMTKIRQENDPRVRDKGPSYDPPRLDRILEDHKGRRRRDADR